MKVFSMVLTLVLMILFVGDQSTSSMLAQSAVSNISGEWLMSGKASEPCAIFRQGAVLLIVNEKGDLATGRMDGESKLLVLKGDHWETGVTAELKNGGKSLSWRDGSVWIRR